MLYTLLELIKLLDFFFLCLHFLRLGLLLKEKENIYNWWKKLFFLNKQWKFWHMVLQCNKRIIQLRNESFLGIALILGPSTTMLVLTPTLHSLSRPQKERFFPRWGEEKDNCVSERERERDQIFYSAIFLVNVDLEKKKEKKGRVRCLLACWSWILWLQSAKFGIKMVSKVCWRYSKYWSGRLRFQSVPWLPFLSIMTEFYFW